MPFWSDHHKCIFQYMVGRLTLDSHAILTSNYRIAVVKGKHGSLCHMHKHDQNIRKKQTKPRNPRFSHHEIN